MAKPNSPKSKAGISRVQTAKDTIHPGIMNLLLRSSGQSQDTFINQVPLTESLSPSMSDAMIYCTIFMAMRLRQLLVPSALACIGKKKTTDEYFEGIIAIGMVITEKLRSSSALKIHSLIQELVLGGQLCPPSATTGAAATAARQLVFNILGCITMLYTPGIVGGDELFLRVRDDGPTSFSNPSQDIEMAKRPLLDLLHGFGKFLPERGAESDDQNDVLHVASMNAASLRRFNGVKIKWITSLAGHLDFDAQTGVLSVFCLPSFCQLHKNNETFLEKLLQDSYYDFHRPRGFSASAFMEEILRTYCLLFRDDRKGRRDYSRIHRKLVKSIIPGKGSIDPLLDELCGYRLKEKGIPGEGTSRSHYSRGKEFPIFGGRLLLLQKRIDHDKPGRMKALWNDKRDFDALYTFRALIIFGVVGVVLGLLQIALQMVQTIYTVKSYQSPS